MKNDQERWNKKYLKKLGDTETPAANERLVKWTSNLPKGTCLDVACGLGGNSLYLARLGHQVKAVDVSDIAIGYLQKEASRENLAIEAQVIDLTTALPEFSAPFDLIIDTYYLDRSLYPLMKEWLKPGGFIFMETFYSAPNDPRPKIKNEYKLYSGELMQVFGSWNVHHFEENDQEGIQSIFVQKPV